MAALIVGLIIWLQFCSFVKLQDNAIAYQTPDNCKTGANDKTHEFFDYSTMSCKPCSENATVQTASSDLLTCVCKAGFKYITNFGGVKVKCQKCGNQEIVSSDGWECLKCDTDSCKGCSTDQFSVEREVNGSWKKANSVVCETCVADTKLNMTQDRCLRCSEFLSIRTDLNTCKCDNVNNEADGLCFKTGDDLKPAKDTTMFSIPLETHGSVKSAYFVQHLRAAEVLCRVYRKSQSCQQLANMCTLLLYDMGSSRTGSQQACKMFQDIQDPLNEVYKPMLFYTGKGIDAIFTNDLPTSYTFSPVSYLKYKMAAYTLEGKFLGLKDVTGGLIQLCQDSEKKLDAAFRFGTVYSQSCTITALNLWNQAKYPLVFYDPYLDYVDVSGKRKLYRIPVLITNYRDTNAVKVNEGETVGWKLVRRFFLVDNIATISDTTTEKTQSSNASYVRYVKSLTMVVYLQTGTTEGKINPPYLQITYGEISRSDASLGKSIETSLRVTYEMDQGEYIRNFQIATGTLSTLGVLYAGYRAWVWSRRDGRIAIDFPTLINFIFFLASSLSNTFFVVTFGIAFYWLIFYKRQDAVYIVHPTGQAVFEWHGLFGAAFALKCLSIIHLLFSQCFIDIFFIDWERPKSMEKNRKGETIPVSIWRTYFVANEWNELQTTRKINKILQIFSVVFFLIVVGFENVTTKDSNGQVLKDGSEYRAEESDIYRYAVAAIVYVIVALVQWLFYTFFYERFVEDKISQFVDLCSMCNVSLFILPNAEFGYYIHGRSVHGRADTDMKEMHQMLKKEEEDLVGQRGLEANTEEQTFQMRIPKGLREKYKNAYLPMALANTARQKDDNPALEAYAAINKLLAAFIDHSLRNLDYTVRPKTLLEGIMDTEFIDITSEKGILYNDNGHSFDQVLFFGHEFTLLTFDLLLFCTVDLIWGNFVLAGFLTYLISEVPYMLCPGNHESQFQFAGYLNWYTMPTTQSGSTSPFWYSFDYMGIHFVSYSTEHDFTQNSTQNEWIKQDLIKANSNRGNVPWIMVFGHRPLYCTSFLCSDRCDVEAPMYRSYLEDLLYQQKVDVVMSGHDHSYERSYPVYKEKATQKNYDNPKAPVYIVNGAAGNPEWNDPSFKLDVSWRAHAQFTFATGYLLLQSSPTQLNFQYVISKYEQIVDQFTITKTSNKS